MIFNIIPKDKAADTIGQETSSSVEEASPAIAEPFPSVAGPSPSSAEPQPILELPKTQKELHKKNKHKSRLIIAAAVLLICLCSAFVAANGKEKRRIKCEERRISYINNSFSDINTLLSDKNFNNILTFSLKNQDTLKKGEFPHIQQISALISNDEFDNALDYCKANGKELKIYFKGWIQDGKLYSSKKYNETAPVIYFENNPDENSFYIYTGLFDSKGKRQGDGKELCIYYSTGNYYYASGQWKNDILDSGTATNRRRDSKTGEIFIRSGDVKQNKYHSYITLTTIGLKNDKQYIKPLVSKDYRIEK